MGSGEGRKGCLNSPVACSALNEAAEDLTVVLEVQKLPCRIGGRVQSG